MESGNREKTTTMGKLQPNPNRVTKRFNSWVKECTKTRGGFFGGKKKKKVCGPEQKKGDLQGTASTGGGGSPARRVGLGKPHKEWGGFRKKKKMGHPEINGKEKKGKDGGGKG